VTGEWASTFQKEKILEVLEVFTTSTASIPCYRTDGKGLGTKTILFVGIHQERHLLLAIS
jgi:hypothetical protein